MPLSHLRRPYPILLDRVAIAVTVGLILFGSLWGVVRFSLAVGEFSWMQRAYDEPFYLWRVFTHDFAIDNRLLANLFAAAWGGLTGSFDAMAEIVGLVMPLAVFSAAWVLSGTWDRVVIRRLIWTLLLVFAFDLLSFSNYVLFDTQPSSWIAKAIGDPRIWKVDAMAFFVAYRRPEPQMGWLISFIYLAGVVASFTNWRPTLYRLICAATPFLVIVYINAALICIIVFGLTSLIAIVVYRRPAMLPFALSTAATIAAFFVVVLANPASNIESNTFTTRLPILRPSAVMAALGLLGLAMAIARRGWAPLSRHWLAAVFLAVPLITLNQQIITGVAILPQNWELNGNYFCIVAGLAILASGWLHEKKIGRSAVMRGIFGGLWVLLGVFVVRGHLRVEANFVPSNTDSVAYARVYREATKVIGKIDVVVLPHLFDESLFVTRAPRGASVLGGYNSLILKPAPRWRTEEGLAEHAQRARRNFDVGFETLARQSVPPSAVGLSLGEEVRSAVCWPTLMYFFSQSDCWPTFSNFNSPNRERMTSIAAPMETFYAAYLQRLREMPDIRPALLITNAPVPAIDQTGTFSNRLVATVVVRVRDYEAKAYAYHQTKR
jgi:hypothetical protein